MQRKTDLFCEIEVYGLVLCVSGNICKLQIVYLIPNTENFAVKSWANVFLKSIIFYISRGAHATTLLF